MNLNYINKIMFVISSALLSFSMVSCNNSNLECDHNWDKGVITKEATCESDGEIIYTCINCNETKTEVLIAQHTFIENDCIKCGKQDYTEGLYFYLYNEFKSYAVSLGKATDPNIIIPTTLNGLPVTEINYEGFRNCKFLKSITIPEGIEKINNDAFSGCKALESVILPKSVKYISSYAFTDCESLKSINIPHGVTTIGKYAFAGCSSLTSIDIPDSVTSLEFCAFNSCSSLENINIPNSVTLIGDWNMRGSYVFAGCTSLKHITLPDNILSLNPGLFHSCDMLTSVTIGSNVQFIAVYAFENCGSLTTIYFKGTQEQWNNIEISETGNSVLNNVTVIYNYKE